MKIRNGFVSNSSSSSFVVMNRDLYTGNRVLSNEQIDELFKFGFFPTNSINTMSVYCNKVSDASKTELKENSFQALGYYVHCNQDDVIEFLVEKNIAFIALCHYGHETIIYDGENMYRIPNYGIMAEMYHNDEEDKKKMEEYKIKL